VSTKAESYDHVVNSRARALERATRAERDARIWYSKLRQLENKVRAAIAKSAAASTPDEAQEACIGLLRDIPKHPRPTPTELRKKNLRRP